MQKKKGHSKNLSKQAIDLINYYNNLRTSITNEFAMMNLNKKMSIYIADQPIAEEDVEDSPIGLKRNCSKTEHVNINIYSQPYDLDEELQQDVKQLKQTLNQSIYQRQLLGITQLKSIINQSEKMKSMKNQNNKENQCQNNQNLVNKTSTKKRV
ncbi:unnamed protein product [Paramecium octaurelia]|uniref:Uncharacterized protein n=1 Tax=Paramecium octaurelia TaxID=43137 RepID=A0A8S1T8R9_PAROT|nr:unnamed protein product [Paramecium octaurelia]